MQLFPHAFPALQTLQHIPARTAAVAAHALKFDAPSDVAITANVSTARITDTPTPSFSKQGYGLDASSSTAIRSRTNWIPVEPDRHPKADALDHQSEWTAWKVTCINRKMRSSESITRPNFSSAGLSKLSEGEKACLRLVYRHHRTKEIAHELSISVDAAEKRIQTARAKLGGLTRRDAAIALAEAEAGLRNPDIRFSDLPPPPTPAPSTSSSSSRLADGDGLREAAAFYNVEHAAFTTSFRPDETQRSIDDPSIAGRLWTVAKITTATVVAILVALAVAQSISGLWRAERLDVVTSAPR